MKPLPLFILFCLLIVGALVYHASQQDARHSERAGRYLEQTLTDISSWQTDRLWARLAPEAKAAVSREHLTAVVEQYRPLGAFVSMDTPRFNHLTAALSVFGGQPRLAYSFPARFEHGEAQISATLQLSEGSFSLYNFSIRQQPTNH